jgi:arabinan endo-1,5-alpha-L-arabinosidase
MMDGGGTPLLVGNSRWFGPGGESIRQQADGQGDIIVFHAYDGKTGNAYLQISTIDWSGGRPHVALEGDEKTPKVAILFLSQRKLNTASMTSKNN